MNNLKSYALATVGIVSLVASLTINIVSANNAEASTVVSSTAHFHPNSVYLLTPANGGGQIRCNVSQVDGAWLKCGGEKFEWVNTNTMMYADDSK
jgi:hypothetical protein